MIDEPAEGWGRFRRIAAQLAVWLIVLSIAAFVGTELGARGRQLFEQPGSDAAQSGRPTQAAGTVVAIAVAPASPSPSPASGATPAAAPSPASPPAAAAPPPPPPTATSEPAPATSTPAPPTGSPASPTNTPAPPTSPPTTAPAVAVRTTILDERFANNQRNWPSDPRGSAWLADGAYQLFARQAGQFVGVRAPIAEPLRDVVVGASFRKTGGPAGGGYGIIVRDQGSARGAIMDQGGQFYVLEAGDRGEVGIWRREGDRWVDLLPWTPSAAVRPGQAANELTVEAIGPRLTFLVNGVNVASPSDATLSQGAVGIFVGGDSNQVAVERFTVESFR